MRREVPARSRVVVDGGVDRHVLHEALAGLERDLVRIDVGIVRGDAAFDVADEVGNGAASRPWNLRNIHDNGRVTADEEVLVVEIGSIRKSFKPVWAFSSTNRSFRGSRFWLRCWRRRRRNHIRRSRGWHAGHLTARAVGRSNPETNLRNEMVNSDVKLSAVRGEPHRRVGIGAPSEGVAQLGTPPTNGQRVDRVGEHDGLGVLADLVQPHSRGRRRGDSAIGSSQLVEVIAELRLADVRDHVGVQEVVTHPSIGHRPIRVEVHASRCRRRAARSSGFRLSGLAGVAKLALVALVALAGLVVRTQRLVSLGLRARRSGHGLGRSGLGLGLGLGL